MDEILLVIRVTGKISFYQYFDEFDLFSLQFPKYEYS